MDPGGLIVLLMQPIQTHRFYGLVT